MEKNKIKNKNNKMHNSLFIQKDTNLSKYLNMTKEEKQDVLNKKEFSKIQSHLFYTPNLVLNRFMHVSLIG